MLVVPVPVTPLPLAAPRLEPQAPTASIALLTPAEAAILADTTPAFDWEDVAGAFAYGFQLAGDPGFSWIISDIYSLGTSDYSQRKALNVGATYYWRVSFKMEDGAWSAWSSERSFRVEWSPAISAVYPADGAKIPESRPTLSWSPAASAFSYELQLAEGPTGFDASASIRTARPSYRPSSAYLNQTTRYWRVRPENADGAFGAWQGPWRFTIEVPRPQLSSPEEGAALGDTTPSFDWSDVALAAGYRFQLASDAVFEDIIEDEVDLNSSEYTQPTALDNGKRYFWRVRAKDGEGTWSSWTPLRTMTIEWKPSISATYPSDGAKIPESRPVLAWSAAAEAAGYELQIADSPAAFGSARSIATVAPSYQPSGAYANSTVKVWRVRAKNVDGAFGPWAGPWVFSIDLERPRLAVPADAATLSDATPDFSWNEVSGATAYRFQLSTDASFENIAISANNLTAPSYAQWEPLKNGQKYYWRVMARDVDGIWGSWTETRILTVDWNPAISAVFPKTDEAIADATPLLEWTDAPEAKLYELQLSDSIQGFASASSIPAVASRYQTTQAVPNGSVKYWRVRARNADGVPSAWQGPWSFSIAWNPAIAVLLPSDGATAAQAAPLLD
ncbi:MAG: hypothetical protein Q8M76_00090, partial [Spirochaetaceae bacterium]|nr:hypothetical protein [Spirochaetaceae bacterium]